MILVLIDPDPYFELGTKSMSHSVEGCLLVLGMFGRAEGRRIEQKPVFLRIRPLYSRIAEPLVISYYNDGSFGQKTKYLNFNLWKID